MRNSSRLQANGLFLATFSFVVFCVEGSPARITSGSGPENARTKLNYFKNPENSSRTLDCSSIEYSAEDVTLLTTNRLYIKKENTTVHFTDYLKKGNRILICPSFQHVGNQEIILNCSQKFFFGSDEFQILPNNSALVHGTLISPQEYKLKGKELLTCAPDYDDYSDTDIPKGITLRQASIYTGMVGSGLSIIALIAHLVTFCVVPALRNLPGCNLASLSVAFMLAYSFSLISQIPEVLGLSCIVSAVLQMNFFLSAFFWMNVLAFDVWRTLKLATEKFAVGSQRTRKRQFIWYSLYAWGCPLAISITSVIADNSEYFPDAVKPNYGASDVCWLTNTVAKTIFFVVPALTLVAINAIFFILSLIMISSNTMKYKNDQSNQTVKLNYFLYVKLGLMMGLTWLMGVIALICSNSFVWFISDLLNSSQGLLLFLFFTCTRKVQKVLRERTGSAKKSVSDKDTTTLSSNSNNFSTKTRY